MVDQFRRFGGANRLRHVEGEGGAYTIKIEIITALPSATRSISADLFDRFMPSQAPSLEIARNLVLVNIVGIKSSLLGPRLPPTL